jgi:hypothetical protein
MMVALSERIVPVHCSAAHSSVRGGWWILPTVALIAGWVFEYNVVRFLERVSRYVGYECDDLDRYALTGALENADDELADRWFSYPLRGRPPIVVSPVRR